MTLKQIIMKKAYPLIMRLSRKSKGKVLRNGRQARPNASFYDLKTTSNALKEVDLSAYKGKKVLVVNTASHCGFTNQYDDLQHLQDAYKDKLVILGFPANDFNAQEPEDDAAIAQFCKVNFGVTFPLMQKSQVIAGTEQNPVFKWLTNDKQNGWNNQAPEWNFSKYLVNENGVLTHYFGPAVSPMDTAVQKAIDL